MKKKLELAIQLSKSGDKEQARTLLRELVDESPEMLNAWFWLVDAMPTDEERIGVLKEAVSHHGDDKRLTGALSKLLATQVEVEPEQVVDAVEEISILDDEEPLDEESVTSESLDDFNNQLESDFFDDEEEDEQEVLPKSKPAKRSTANSRYLLIVFVLLIAALATAWFFRDSLIALWTGEDQAVIAEPTDTAVVVSELPTGTPEPSATLTKTPTTEVIEPTQTSPVTAVDGTPTQVIITTPTETAVVEEGKFVSVSGSQLNDIAWSQNGDLFAVAGDGGITIYDGETFVEKVHIVLDPVIPVLTLTFSPDNKYIAAGFDQATTGEELITRAKMWQVNDGAEVMSFDYNAPRGDINTLAFSMDGETLLMNAQLDAILKWRVSDGALLEVFKLSESSVDYYGVVFSPDRLSYATYSKFDRVRIHDTLFGEQIAVLGEEKDITKAVFSANNQYLAVMFEEQPVVYLWDLPSKEKIKVWNTFGGNVTSMAFNADNQTLAVGTDEDLIKFYQIRTGEEQRVISRQIPGVQEMEFAPDDILFAVRNNHEIQIWHLLTDTLVATFRVVD